MPGFDADPFHTRDDWLIGDVRRVNLHDLGGIGEIFVARHGIHLNLRRRLHIHGRINLAGYGLGGFPPSGQRGDLVAGLDLMNGVVVRRTVGLGAADDPYVRCRCLDLLQLQYMQCMK